jgi:hypothetical protein
MSAAYATAERTPTIRHAPRYRSQPSRLSLQYEVQDTEAAAKAVTGTWVEQGLKKHGNLKFAISRARQDGGPVRVLFCWLRSLHAAGFPMWMALHLPAAIEAFIRRVWQAGQVCTKDETLVAASVAEQESQHAVDLLQLALADKFNADEARALVELARVHVAKAEAMILCYELRLEREGR